MLDYQEFAPPTPGEGLDVTRSLSCWLDVDLDAVATNVVALRRWVGPRTQIAAVVKAQAYGVGSREVARTALHAGATWLAVARVHEAEELRAAGIGAPILVLTRTDPCEADLAVRLGVSVTVDDLDLGRALSSAARRCGRWAGVHVKIDTGLNRLGVRPADAGGLMRDLSGLSGLEFQALYTHFASADDGDETYTKEQLGDFQNVTDELRRAGHVFPLRHAANSAAALAHRAAHLDMVRIGLGLYGVSPSGETPEGLNLTPALALRARVVRIFDVAAGDTVGYGQSWRAAAPSRVAILGAGYADGISRLLSNRGVVAVDGRKVRIIGRVSMDLTAIDVTSVPTARVGTIATFFGQDDGQGISLHQFANQAETIPHEVLSLVGARVVRVYHSSGRVARAARLSGTVELANPDPACRP